MDRLFAISTCKTVWQSLVEKRSVQEVLEERREARPVYYDEKRGVSLTQVESIDTRQV